MERGVKKFILIFLAAAIVSGCTKVKHIDQLLTLKALADEQTRMGKYVDERDKQFEQMLAEMEAGTLDQHANKRKIVRIFGDPIYVRNAEENGKSLEVWLYRYATEFFDSEKIYLYFDSDDNLVKSEYMEVPNGEVR